MISEPQRRQYLSAMGITGWEARFCLPNALETPACDWEWQAPAEGTPSEKIHALLEQTAGTTDPEPLQPDRSASVRALLDDASDSNVSAEGHSSTDSQASPSTVAEHAPAPSPPLVGGLAAAPLRFSLTGAAINRRWLVLYAGEEASGDLELLHDLLSTAGLEPAEALECMPFDWPLIEAGWASEDPVQEARDGVRAFIQGGERRNGWKLEQLLWWGPLDSPLDAVMQLDQGSSATLQLPLWQGPALSELRRSGDTKRQLLPELLALGQKLA